MLELNEANFIEETREGVVLVDFYTQWCGPCKMMAPTLEKLTNAKVVKFDVGGNPAFAAKHNVQAVPCLVFLKDGVETTRLVGVQNLSTLQGKIDELNS